jgi:hypothetical protein
MAARQRQLFSRDAHLWKEPLKKIEISQNSSKLRFKITMEAAHFFRLIHCLNT